MTALAAVSRPPLTVIEGGRKRGRPSKADDAVLELAMRASEEQAMDVAMAPLLDRLEVIARHAGPSMWRTVAEVVHIQTRHARRWQDEGGRAA
ncbi:MAG: hypothetical protein KF809_17275 [Chloroflexi bacterium]|nr:hypothetical protein [Chloroflexota bacterium]